MPIAIQLKEGVLHIDFCGEITPQDLVAVVEQTRSFESSGMHAPDRFTDTSGADAIAITFDAMSDFAALRTEAVIPNPVKNAVFAPTEVHFGLARMFQQMNRNPNIELRVFRTRDEAWAWLKA
jgi:hypothetical protein